MGSVVLTVLWSLWYPFAVELLMNSQVGCSHVWLAVAVEELRQGMTVATIMLLYLLVKTVRYSRKSKILVFCHFFTSSFPLYVFLFEMEMGMGMIVSLSLALCLYTVNKYLTISSSSVVCCMRFTANVHKQKQHPKHMHLYTHT